MLTSAPFKSTPAPSRAGLLAAHLCETLWLATLMVIPLTMNVAGVRTFEAAKLAASAPLAALALCALIAAWIDGAARRPPGILRQPALIAFAGLTACAILSTLASDTPWISVFGDYFRREGLISWLLYATLFASVISLMRERVQLERLIDATLLASVVPCVYALQQVYGYDFFMTAGLAQTRRPGGNLGNPIFLSAYLLLLIPVTIARLLRTPKPWLARLPWLVLLGMQLLTAFLTQSRGPLFGLAAALFLLALTIGAVYRARALVFGAIAGALLLGLGLLALNFMPGVQTLLKDYPLILRFSFTSGASLTANSRIGIWQMGVDAFLHAPWWRQLIGAGPDSAHFAYFTYEPTWVLRIEGYSETIDRLHSELLETTTTFGVLGAVAEAALFSGLVWIAVARIAGLQSTRLAVYYAALCVAGSAGGAAALAWIGNARGLVPIGLGLGLSIAWAAALSAAAWRGLGASRAHEREDSILVAALACALIGFWVESQVGVPTIATRSLVAVFAAVILLLGVKAFDRAAPAATSALITEPAQAPAEPSDLTLKPAPVKPGKSSKRGKAGKSQAAGARLDSRANTKNAAQAATMRPQTMAGWFTGLALIIITSAFFPPLSGQVIHAPSPQRLHLIIVPYFALLLAGAAVAFYEFRRLNKPLLDALTHFLIWMALPWFTFIVIYAQIGSRITGAPDALVGERINNLLLLEFAAGSVSALWFGLSLYWGDSRRASAQPSKPLATGALVAGLGLAVATYWGAMLDIRADSYAKLGGWALGQGRADASTAFHKTAAELVPNERRFTGTYAARLIEQAAANLRFLQTQPALAPKVLEQLALAEDSIKRAVAVAPGDPWTTFAHANVNQFWALGILERYLPAGERARRIGAAREYFELARKQFPAHPWILRNWAQMEFDLGNRAAAYARFDAMEALDPLNVSAFSERLRFTSAYGDHTIAIAALRKGVAAQPPGSPSAREIKNMLAQYFNQINQPQQALNVYLELIEADPNDASAVYNAALLYERAGQKALALGNVQVALARLANLPRSPQTDADRKKLEEVAARLAR